MAQNGRSVRGKTAGKSAPRRSKANGRASSNGKASSKRRSTARSRPSTNAPAGKRAGKRARKRSPARVESHALVRVGARVPSVARRLVTRVDPRLAAAPLAATGVGAALRAAARHRRRSRRSLKGRLPRIRRRSTGLGVAVRGALRSAVERVPRAGDALAAATPGLVYAISRSRARKRPPIQHSIDVGVPLQFAYEEWMKLEFLPEGAHTVQNIERDGDGELRGRITGGLRPTDWRAEILDERDRESFAWRSTSGSDCAGLITFHRLADRLTRLELQLDVVPANPYETVELALGTAYRRTEQDLRSFKSRLETASPDTYEQSDHNDDKEK